MTSLTSDTALTSSQIVSSQSQSWRHPVPWRLGALRLVWNDTITALPALSELGALQVFDNMSQMRDATEAEITQLIKYLLEETSVYSDVKKIYGSARVHVATVRAADIGDWQTIFGDLGGKKPVDSQRFAVRDVLGTIEAMDNADCITMQRKIQKKKSLITNNELIHAQIVLFKSSTDCYICDGNHRAVAAFQVAHDSQMSITFTVYIIDSENGVCSR